MKEINNQNNLPKEEQPQERLLNFGANHLSNQELLSVLLGVNTETTKQLLIEFEGIKLLNEATIEELTAVKGIGKTKGTQMLAAIELGKRINRHKPVEAYIIRSPEDAANYLMEELRQEKQERFVVLFLDTKNKVFHKETVFVGSLNASIVHPREVFRIAVKRSAASIIVCHQHPSGDPTPSQEDIHVTRRLAEVGNLMGIPVLDHIIIGDRRFVSLKEKGYI